MQLTIEKVRETVKRHGSQRKAAVELGIAQSTVNKILSDGAVASHRPSAAPGHIGGRSLSEFRETHDKGFIVPKKVRAALAALGSGWEYEVAFSKLAGVSLGDLSAYRALFEDHIVLVEKSKRAWAGTKATAEKMRAML